MRHFRAEYAQSLYLPELSALFTEGQETDVRGRKTWEILDGATEITQPQHHCILIPERRWNPWLALSEALWILAGRNDVAALAPYNSHITDYSDDGVTLYGAYGARIYDQIDEVIARLRKYPSDRRAVLQIWDGGATGEIEKGVQNESLHYDLTVNSKDPPCNNLLYFKLRQQRLHMTVICRSNDIHFGLFAVNIPTFGILQEYIAARLGVELGHQTHLSNSLHVYTDDKRAVDITHRMIHAVQNAWPQYPAHERAFTHLEKVKDHSQIAEMCDEVLEIGGYNPAMPDFLNFASSFLKQYREKAFDPTSMPLAVMWLDWVMAGKIFVKEVWKR